MLAVSHFLDDSRNQIRGWARWLREQQERRDSSERNHDEPVGNNREHQADVTKVLLVAELAQVETAVIPSPLMIPIPPLQVVEWIIGKGHPSTRQRKHVALGS